jgi:hypothetical protein
VTEQVGREDHVVAGEDRQEVAPRVRGVTDPVQQQERRPSRLHRSGDDERTAVAVDGAELKPRLTGPDAGDRYAGPAARGRVGHG